MNKYLSIKWYSIVIKNLLSKYKFRELFSKINYYYYCYKSNLKFFYKKDLKSEKDKKYLNEILNTGFTKIENSFEELSNHLNNEYFNKLLNNEKIKHFNINLANEKDIAMGRFVKSYISLDEKIIKSIFCNKEIMFLLRNYFKGQFFVRSLPTIQIDNFNIKNFGNLNESEKKGSSFFIQNKFHIDAGFKQVHLNLMCSNHSNNDTHTEFIPYRRVKKNRFKIYKKRYSFDDNDLEQDSKIVPICGNEGEIFIFDAGQYFHRAKYKSGKERRIFQIIFNNVGPWFKDNNKNKELDKNINSRKNLFAIDWSKDVVKYIV